MEGVLIFIDAAKEFFIQNGAWGLFILAFTEASFFPVPPDIVLLPLALITPSRALYYAAITSIASSLGGIFGYLIGLRAGRPILSRYINENNFYKIEKMFAQYGGWAVGIAGFTPIPYKVFTIASGVFHMDFSTFFIATILSRSARFFLVAAFVLIMGEGAMTYIGRLLGPGSFILLAVVAVLYMIISRSGITRGFKLKEKLLHLPMMQKLKRIAAIYGELGIYLLASLSTATVLGFLFFKLAAEVLEREMEWFDKGIISQIGKIQFGFLKPITYIFDKAQHYMIFAILMVICLLYIKLYFRRSIYPFMAFIAFSGSFLLQWGFKSFYKIPRLFPKSNNQDLLAFAYSFPSGFIVVFTALTGYILFLLLKKKNTPNRFFIIGSWVLTMLIVGMSRIHAGISYPSDVLAGFLLGGLWLAICIVASKILEHNS